jgi:hypothetical protein
VLTVSTGSLKSLSFDHGPASPNLSVLLQAVPRLVFEVMKACCLLHVEFISYFVLVLRALSALTVKQAFCGLSPELHHRSMIFYPHKILFEIHRVYCFFCFRILIFMDFIQIPIIFFW